MRMPLLRLGQELWNLISAVDCLLDLAAQADKGLPCGFLSPASSVSHELEQRHCAALLNDKLGMVWRGVCHIHQDSCTVFRKRRGPLAPPQLN